jgi:hypothetical protein
MNIPRKFPCSKCGECCKRIGLIAPELVDPETGWCKYLDPDTNLCTIYEDRPLICNIDRAYDEIFKDKMTRDEWYRENLKYCKKFQNEK